MIEFKSGAIDWDKSKLEAESAIVHGLKNPQFFWDRYAEDITDKSYGWNLKLDHSVKDKYDIKFW